MLLVVEKLEKNNLPLPSFQTSGSAGIDFAACLTRQCYKIDIDGTKKPFLAAFFNSNYDLERIHLDNGSVEEKLSNYNRLLEIENAPILRMEPNETIMIPLGCKVAIESGYYMSLHVRSSIGISGLMLANGTGIVDSDYRGDVYAVLWNRRDRFIDIIHGQRIVQGIINQCNTVIIIEDKVEPTLRNEGGFGSTGK